MYGVSGRSEMRLLSDSDMCGDAPADLRGQNEGTGDGIVPGPFMAAVASSDRALTRATRALTDAVVR
jgi:hypothetical protein